MSSLPHSSDLPPPVIHEFAPVARRLLGCTSRVELLAGGDAAAIRSEIEDEIRKIEPRVLSFDVFDTFLLRNDKAEAARYLELSHLIRERLNAVSESALSPHDILLARVDALKLSYRLRPAVEGCREGHIEQVVRIACRALGLAPATERLLLEAELDYEAANLAINPVLLDIAAQFRADGGKVILVSDMYLGRTQIEEILKRVYEPALEIVDSVFSSADHGVSKRAGKMYGFIDRQFDLPANAFLHVGDAWEGDVWRCREAGWSALHFPVAREETRRREESLAQIRADVDRLGLDVSDWAKI